ncbi:MAG: hypothetical protein KatS3mg071_1713 [Meiothermus sp.]|jgi:hypothetical protein|nr:MAG: hypothetical protein KatS3mg071_1713 [Meiothermus sp.]
MYYLARWQGRGPEPVPGSHGVAWATIDGKKWFFAREKYSCRHCHRKDLLLLSSLEVGEIPRQWLESERYELITDPSLCAEVLVEIGMAQQIAQWPTLLVWRNQQELVEVWGSRFLPACPDDPVALLYPELQRP